MDLMSLGLNLHGWLTADVQMAYNVVVEPVGEPSGSSVGKVIRMSTSQFEVTGLSPDTSFNIMVTLKDPKKPVWRRI